MNKPVCGRTCSLGIVLALYVFLEWWGWRLESLPLGQWMSNYGKWNFPHHALFLLIPALAILWDRQRRVDYGLTLRHAWTEAFIGLAIMSLFVALPMLAELFWGRIALSPRFQEFPVCTVLFQFVFAGIGEELFYRGFCQGELNRSWGRPLRIGKIRFGIGYVLTALLFSLGHGANLFQWLNSKFPFNGEAFAGALAFAFLAGLVRERTGGLLAVVLMHIGVNVLPVFVESGPAGYTGYSLAYAASASFLWYWMPTWKEPPLPGQEDERPTSGNG